MKKLVLTVLSETHRDVYNALRSATDLVDLDFSSGSGTAPCFDFKFSIVDLDEIGEKFNIELIRKNTDA